MWEGPQVHWWVQRLHLPYSATWQYINKIWTCLNKVYQKKKKDNLYKDGYSTFVAEEKLEIW